MAGHFCLYMVPFSDTHTHTNTHTHTHTHTHTPMHTHIHTPRDGHSLINMYSVILQILHFTLFKCTSVYCTDPPRSNLTHTHTHTQTHTLSLSHTYTHL